MELDADKNWWAQPGSKVYFRDYTVAFSERNMLCATVLNIRDNGRGAASVDLVDIQPIDDKKHISWNDKKHISWNNNNYTITINYLYTKQVYSKTKTYSVWN